MTLKRVTSVATVAALLVFVVGAGPIRGQPPADSPSGQVPEAPSGADEVAPADSVHAEDHESDQPRAEPEEGGPGVPPGESVEGAEERGSGQVDTGSDDGDEEPDPVPEGTAPSGLVVFRAYICKGIEQSEPTEAGKSFIPAADGVLRLCCFSEIGGAARPDTVFHVWYWGDREMARVPLRVEGARWRTWSSKRIVDEWRGDWRVDIVDPDGFILKRLTFSVE
jgi:hypothetical protein